MKRKLLFLAVALALLNPSNLGAAALTSISITNTAGLAFGSFIAGGGGTVAVSAAGVRTNTGGVVLVPSDGGAAASFNVVGTTFPTTHVHSYSITLPANGTVTLAGPGTPMAVNNFVSTPPAGTSTGTLAKTTVSEILTVGATLTVGAGQTPGAYSGTFNVTDVFP